MHRPGYEGMRGRAQGLESLYSDTERRWHGQTVTPKNGSLSGVEASPLSRKRGRLRNLKERDKTSG